MSNYTKTTDFAAKDNLLSGNPAKLIKGSEHDTEYNNISTAIGTKVDSGGALGTPSSGTLTNCTGLPPSTGLSAAVGVSKGGTGLTTIAAKSIPVANALDTYTTVTPGAGQSIRINAGNTAWEAYTPSTGTGDFLADGSVVMTGDLQIGTGKAIIFEGSTADAYETTLTVVDPTADRTVTIPNETMTVGFRNIPAVGTKTGSYNLAVGDVGKYVQCGSGAAITIPDATFAEGDVISIVNNTTGNITITCTITTAYISGTDSDKATVTLATRGVATIFFLSGTVCVISGNVS